MDSLLKLRTAIAELDANELHQVADLISQAVETQPEDVPLEMHLCDALSCFATNGITD